MAVLGIVALQLKLKIILEYEIFLLRLHSSSILEQWSVVLGMSRGVRNLFIRPQKTHFFLPSVLSFSTSLLFWNVTFTSFPFQSGSSAAIPSTQSSFFKLNKREGSHNYLCQFYWIMSIADRNWTDLGWLISQQVRR